MSQKTYRISLAGLQRDLPLCAISEHTDIAAFILLGDVELTVACARELLQKVPQDFDIILTPEAKSITLAHEMAKMSGKPYVVARKGAKLYMPDPISASVQSITTAHPQTLYLGQDEAAKLTGRRVLIVDDVVSTGGSIDATIALAKKAGGIVYAQATVLAEGDAAKREGLVYLGVLPLFSR